MEPYNCRRFQRVNAESVQLSLISRSYWGGWRRPEYWNPTIVDDFSVSMLKVYNCHLIHGPYQGGCKVALDWPDHWNHITVDDFSVSMLKVYNCHIFHAHTRVAGGVVSLARSLEPYNCRRFQRVNAESVQLSPISRSYWGGCKAVSD